MLVSNCLGPSRCSGHNAPVPPVPCEQTPTGTTTLLNNLQVGRRPDDDYFRYLFLPEAWTPRPRRPSRAHISTRSQTVVEKERQIPQGFGFVVSITWLHLLYWLRGSTTQSLKSRCQATQSGIHGLAR